MVLTERLQTEAGMNPRLDAHNSGYIAAVKDFLRVSMEDLEE